MTTGKTIALTRWTFVGKVMSLLFLMLSRLVTTFLPPDLSVCCFHALCSAPLGSGHHRAGLRLPRLQLLFLSLPEALSEADGQEEPGPSPGSPSGSEGAGPELHRQGVD